MLKHTRAAVIVGRDGPVRPADRQRIAGYGKICRHTDPPVRGTTSPRTGRFRSCPMAEAAFARCAFRAVWCVWPPWQPRRSVWSSDVSVVSLGLDVAREAELVRAAAREPAPDREPRPGRGPGRHAGEHGGRSVGTGAEVPSPGRSPGPGRRSPGGRCRRSTPGGRGERRVPRRVSADRRTHVRHGVRCRPADAPAGPARQFDRRSYGLGRTASRGLPRPTLHSARAGRRVLDQLQLQPQSHAPGPPVQPPASRDSISRRWPELRSWRPRRAP